MDYRLFNFYSNPLTNARTKIHRLLEFISKEWNIFSVLDLEQGFLQLKISFALQELFAFELRGKLYTYMKLSQR